MVEAAVAVAVVMVFRDVEMIVVEIVMAEVIEMKWLW